MTLDRHQRAQRERGLCEWSGYPLCAKWATHILSPKKDPVNAVRLCVAHAALYDKSWHRARIKL